MGPVPCKDGWVAIGIALIPQWEGMCIAIDKPELLVDDRFQNNAERFDNADAFNAELFPRLAEIEADTLVEILQEHRVPAAKVLDVSEFLVDRQVSARDFWAAVEVGGQTGRLPSKPFHIPTSDPPFRPAPTLGRHGSDPERARLRRRRDRSAGGRERSAPRQWGCGDDPRGRARIEFSIASGRPLAGRFLGDLGAEVIKVEHPTSRGGHLPDDPSLRERDGIDEWTWGTLPGPVFRSGIFPDAEPGDQPWNRQGVFNKMNRNKRSLGIDLKLPGGREVFDRLVAASDVVLNNYSPRGVRSLGIDYESLAAINPHIIAVSLSGFGATGPDQARVSWGPMLEAQSGLAASTGYPDRGPLKMGPPCPTRWAVHGALAVLAALSERDRTGKGHERRRVAARGLRPDRRRDLLDGVAHRPPAGARATGRCSHAPQVLPVRRRRRVDRYHRRVRRRVVGAGRRDRRRLAARPGPRPGVRRSTATTSSTRRSAHGRPGRTSSS
jgi:crotonobetainyl-CoA:carnitine CoA-transferase CaiB-like acyl-CoA transferase